MTKNTFLLVSSLMILFVGQSIPAVGSTQIQERISKRDALTSEISNLKEQRTRLQKEFDEKIKSASRRSGYDAKYIRSQYEDDSFYNTITPEEVTAYAQLAANVYEKGNDKKLQKKDPAKLEYEGKHDDLQLLLNLLEQTRSDLQKNAFDRNAFVKRIKENFKDGTAAAVDSVETREDALEVLASIKSEKLSLQEAYATKLEQLSDPYIDVMQNLPALSVNGLFKGARVLSSIRRNNGEFSGILIYVPSRDEAIVVFAGTKSWLDWFKNFQYWGAQGDPLFGIGRGLNVHTGVMKVVREGLNGVVREVAKMTKSTKVPAKITTTGHSLAGGLSTLFAHYIKTSLLIGEDKKATQVRNINFASLRIVDEPSAKIMENDLGKGNILRFWNKWDVVPAVTPGFLNSKHVGLDFMIEDSLWREIYKPLINWHSMTFYYNYAGKTFAQISNEAQERERIETGLTSINNLIAKKEQEQKALSQEIAELRKDTLAPEIASLKKDLSNTKSELKEITNRIKGMSQRELADLSKEQAAELLATVERLQKRKQELEEKLVNLEWEQVFDEEYVDKPLKEDNVLDKLKLLQDDLQTKPKKREWWRFFGK